MPGSQSASNAVSFSSATLAIKKEKRNALWTIAVILLVLWLLGLVSSYTVGGFIHVLLVVAIAVVLIGALQGRRP
jgi:hypothetical protein